jgi:hypothetical protein
MHRSKQHRHSILREMLDAGSSFREIAKSLTNRNVRRCAVESGIRKW